MTNSVMLIARVTQADLEFIDLPQALLARDLERTPELVGSLPSPLGGQFLFYAAGAHSSVSSQCIVAWPTGPITIPTPFVIIAADEDGHHRSMGWEERTVFALDSGEGESADFPHLLFLPPDMNPPSLDDRPE
jgi:hypothetical protein